MSFKVIDTPRVVPVASIEEAAAMVAQLYAFGRREKVKVRACVSLTRDRDLTASEQAQLVALAAERLR